MNIVIGLNKFLKKILQHYISNIYSVMFSDSPDNTPGSVMDYLPIIGIYSIHLPHNYHTFSAPFPPI